MIGLIAAQTLKNSVKDKIFWLIVSLIVMFAVVPFFSSFSMRQVQEVSITMSLTLNSTILLFLAVFGGVATVWRDIERKYVYTVLGNPVSRTSFIIGRFAGFAVIMLILMLLNIVFSFIVIKISAAMYESDLPVLWGNILTAFCFQYLKYLLVMAFGFLFSSFSTSFFVPFFATVAVYIAGNASQGIYEYVLQKAAADYSAFFEIVVKGVYYILPNFSGMDFVANATYALDIALTDVIFSFCYFLIYFILVFSLTLIIFNKRDFT
ncbi:ABC transporter permease subunit [Flexistipes sinusarabici]|nr:ABC transporter permease subunit [Flexistipes sinusarabici]